MVDHFIDCASLNGIDQCDCDEVEDDCGCVDCGRCRCECEED